MFDAVIATTPFQGLVFGLLTLPICLWVIVTDIKEMKIKNTAVLALLAVFVVAAPFVMPFDEYLWRFAHFGVVLVIGFILATLGVGAGDAKFAAAMAPFIAIADLSVIAYLYVFWSVALLVGMLIARSIPAVQTAAPGWVWFSDGRRRHVPLGVGLAPTLACYFLIAATASTPINTITFTDSSGDLLPPAELLPPSSGN